MRTAGISYDRPRLAWHLSIGDPDFRVTVTLSPKMPSRLSLSLSNVHVLFKCLALGRFRNGISDLFISKRK